MSTKRLPDDRGWARHSQLERGPNGRALCRQCKKEVPKGRRTFCSDDCVHEWKCRTNPGYQACEVLKRDKGVCALCGLDCPALLGELQQLRYGARALRDLEQLDRFKARCDELGLPHHLRGLTRRLWEMDHVKPVVEGGGECGLDNLRTLCWRCHKSETAALRKRRSKKKKDHS